MHAHAPFNCYKPFIGPFDPCPPIKVKCYSTPPNLFMGFQPPNLPQFSPYEALKYGTLWPALFSPYGPVKEGGN
ncbi:spore coat associated protein CotJA [Paenibacillus sp. GXUN7292]|uniref:spore coat associated protein CotJA n=1 Tax=Paenibacillus sp. GXUN7292 TaxID=3422499 RepID=UPI003D7D663A